MLVATWPRRIGLVIRMKTSIIYHSLPLELRRKSGEEFFYAGLQTLLIKELILSEMFVALCWKPFRAGVQFFTLLIL